jgi:hypothetical protein
MPTHPVNLDAIIRREDFAVAVDPNRVQPVEEASKLKIIELETDSFIYRKLRKPDFQRKTSHWPPAKVAAFIKSFAAGDLIPALILWQSLDSGSVFVIDGAHRLSALIAWVHDDYGDRNLSLPFFEGNIPTEQKEAAEETRRIINNTVGSYVELKHSTSPTPERVRYSTNVGVGGVTLQWVRGDASSAERSFHTINTAQTPIGELEVRLIRDRRCPNAIAARALVQAGTGLYYPSTFFPANRERIKALAIQIYDDVFIPPLETPIKTLDLPVAGRGYSQESLRLILDIIEFVNRKPHESTSTNGPKAKRKKKGEASDILSSTMPVDVDGSATIEFLINARKALSRVAGTSEASLGLHPAVYFYSATGAYQPTALLAAIGFVQELEARKELPLFTEHRHDFEELILRYKPFVNQIVKRYGSGRRSLVALTRLFRYLFDGTVAATDEGELVPQLVEDERLSFLKPIVDWDKGTKKDFTTERKSAVFLRQAIETALRCGICRARVHRRSISIDHIERKQDGGVASVDNGQVAHPYCNTGYKEAMHARSIKEAEAEKGKGDGEAPPSV